MIVSDLRELAALRSQRGLDRVAMRMDRLLEGNVALYAIKFAVWAVRHGGRVEIEAPTAIDSVNFTAGRMSFQFLTQLLCKGAEPLARLIACDRGRRQLVFERMQPVLASAPWSAAVVFSGQDSELPFLASCIESLLAQREIADGGQLLVCGPAAAAHRVRDWPSVEYLAFETPTRAGRFLIGEKKNAAMRALRHERILVCHTRMRLEAGCLAAMPQEFDLATPRVVVKGDHGPLPYLDLGFFENHSAAIYSDAPLVPMHYDRSTWLRHLGDAFPYIDGGLFCTRRSLALAVPLSACTAWGEGEDAEWALRLVHNGHVLELVPDAGAESLSCKAPRYLRHGHQRWYRHASNLIQPLRALGNRISRATPGGRFR